MAECCRKQQNWHVVERRGIGAQVLEGVNHG